MLRFILIAIPFSAVVLGIFSAGFDALLGSPGANSLPSLVQIGGWFLEALALAALFLLVQRGQQGSLVDGLLAAWTAWVFRGPILVLTVVAVQGGGKEPWWNLSLRALLAYSVCGAIMATLSRRFGATR